MTKLWPSIIDRAFSPSIRRWIGVAFTKWFSRWTN